ncbi:NADH:flavin oxidoreductase/NADH oxidase [Allokutzneria albata]|uniref:2,4-dienoyl-CoA reductase n=1 Tax=Allokutzneria albata TaxID=211114 RepID=A0A1G9UGK4_ALLAB|nr:NADH:flavin oxidoreductase/NADH oxidase [Allokutzneria albata]SDM58894.1 2,4-dienoyl-CoA reductase [Allokutzneria albata]
MPTLFDPFPLKGVTLRNRIMVSPMCQYSAVDGVVDDWHRAHVAGLARGGAGLVTVEATAVSPEGRISPGCLGLWNDAQADALAPVVGEIKAAGAVAGIQLAHAGRKASANRPWEGDDHIPDDDPRGWPTLSPSAIAFGGGLGKVPREMTVEDIARVRADFVSSAERARDLGFEWLNLHFAHGYLGQSFLSRHANRRTDDYGGSRENRARFLVETLRAVRAVWPEDRPLTARVGVIEFDGHDEETLVDAIETVRDLKADGLDLVDVSMGFSTVDAEIPWGPALLAPYAERVRKEAELPTATSWRIRTPRQANDLIANGQVDLVAIGTALLADPHWPYRAARELGVEAPAATTLPPQYAHWLARYDAS